MNDQIYFKYNSKWGEMVAKVSKSGALKGLWFVGQKHFPKAIPSEIVQITDSKLLVSLKQIEDELRAYEKGTLNHFTLALEPEGTDFQKEVWQILMQIPYGETTTYGDISHKIAKRRNLHSMSSQAVGQAVGRNPISIIVPCHRVIGKNGSLTGYAGGIERKTALLTLEKNGCRLWKNV
ncbi:methylated-DNA--[protein]-cysteine S-methyltransferase [Fusibacter bizertensis]